MNKVNVINNSSPNQWRRYSVYKDSGIEWLGEIPGHWEVKRLKFVARFLYGDPLPSGIRMDGNIPIYGSNGQIGSHNTANTQASCIIIGRKGSCGKIHYSDVPAFVIDTSYVVDERTSNAHTRWLFYCLSLLELDRSSQDTGVPGLSREFAHNRWLPLPPLPEQKAIASFLDKETERIDTLVGKKERLLELLKEKRTALISHAVTKGLDATVAMKDSGIEWLGEIPGHWEILPIRRLTNLLEQGWSPVCEERLASDEEWAVIKLSAVSRGRFRPEEHKALRASESVNERYRLKANDFLLTRSNTPDLVGDVCIVSPTKQRLILCDLVYRLGVWGDRVEKKYLCYWFLSPVGRYQITRDARGSSRSMVKVSQSHIRSWLATLPPLQEQRAIASYLDKETLKLDNLMQKIRESIELLKEYRTALISAAVTGKIDVSKN